jgi:BolA family transcriptional regulator, general stress-responsive regulator
MTAERVDELKRRLSAGLQPTRLHVSDESDKHIGHEGAQSGLGHFSVLVVSERFNGLPTIRRHQLVYDIVGDMMTTDIHALSIKAIAPNELTQ